MSNNANLFVAFVLAAAIGPTAWLSGIIRRI